MWTSESRSKFRTLKVWKEFRIFIIKLKGCKCELCNTEYKGSRIKALQVHHLYPDDYNDLNIEKFRVLCSTCHDDTVERWYKKIMAKNFKVGSYLIPWLVLLKDFLPDLENIKIKLESLGVDNTLWLQQKKTIEKE